MCALSKIILILAMVLPGVSQTATDAAWLEYALILPNIENEESPITSEPLELDDGEESRKLGDIVLNNFLDNKNLRLELEGDIQRNNPSEHEQTTAKILLEASLWQEIDTGNNVKPYIGGGAQYSHVHIDSPSFDERTPLEKNNNGEAIRLVFSAGFNYQVSDNTTLGVNYSYRQPQESELDFIESDDMKLSGHAVMSGIIVTF